MAKTEQVMKLDTCDKHYTVVFKSGTTNPFCLYEHFTTFGEHGWPMKHRKLIVKYCSMEGILLYLLGIPEFKRDVWR